MGIPRANFFVWTFTDGKAVACTEYTCCENDGSFIFVARFSKKQKFGVKACLHSIAARGWRVNGLRWCRESVVLEIMLRQEDVVCLGGLWSGHLIGLVFGGFPLRSGLLFGWVLVSVGFLVGFPLRTGLLFGWVLASVGFFEWSCLAQSNIHAMLAAEKKGICATILNYCTHPPPHPANFPPSTHHFCASRR